MEVLTLEMKVPLSEERPIFTYTKPVKVTDYYPEKTLTCQFGTLKRRAGEVCYVAYEVSGWDKEDIAEFIRQHPAARVCKSEKRR